MFYHYNILTFRALVSPPLAVEYARVRGGFVGANALRATPEGENATTDDT